LFTRVLAGLLSVSPAHKSTAYVAEACIVLVSQYEYLECESIHGFITPNDWRKTIINDPISGEWFTASLTKGKPGLVDVRLDTNAGTVLSSLDGILCTVHTFYV